MKKCESCKYFKQINKKIKNFIAGKCKLDNTVVLAHFFPCYQFHQKEVKNENNKN